MRTFCNLLIVVGIVVFKVALIAGLIYVLAGPTFALIYLIASGLIIIIFYINLAWLVAQGNENE